MKFRKKPVVVDAIQTTFRVKIKTLEGELTAEPGDWIITGVAGEKYPCKPDIFTKTYEPVELGHFYDRRLAYVMITTALVITLLALLEAYLK